MRDYESGLTVERLRSVLSYDKETGIFVWQKNINSRASKGSVAGSKQPFGHLQIAIDKFRYKAHRLAWFHTTGKWPKDQIDHKDGNPANNAWHNLRESNQIQNCQNRSPRTDKIKGVHRDRNKWRAVITINKKQMYLGVFDTQQEAKSVYESMAKKHFGQFSRFN